MSRSPMIRATCALLAAEPEHAVNAVALTGLDDRTRGSLGRSVVNAASGTFSGGTLWLDLAGVAPRLTVIRQVERQLGIPRTGDPHLARRVKKLQASLATRGRALFVLAEPADAELARWVTSDLAPAGSAALLLTGDAALAERLSAAEPDRRAAATDEELTALPDARFCYETLWPALQWRARSLGAFASGPISADLAAQVWGDEAEAAGRALADLCACGLLESRTPASDPFLPVYVQEHAAWRLAVSSEGELVHQRHAEAVLALMGEAEADYRAGGPKGGTAADRFAENWVQIWAAWRYLAGRDDSRGRAAADAFLGAAPHLLALVVPPAVRAAWLAHALRQAAAPGRGRWEARHLAALALAQTELSRPEEAKRNAQQALALAGEIGDAAAVRAAQLELGIALRVGGERASAVELLTQALAGGRAAGDLRLEEEALRELELASSGQDPTGLQNLPGLQNLAGLRADCARRLGDPYAEARGADRRRPR